MSENNSVVAQLVQSAQGTEQAAPAAEAKVAPQESAIDPKLEMYARKERQLRKMAQDIKAQEDAWKKKEQEWSSKSSKYETDYIPKSRLTEDPLTVLQEAGLSYDQLTQQLLQAPMSNDPVIRALKSEMQAMRAQIEQSNKRQEETQSTNYQQAIKQINNDVKMLVQGNAEYEMIEKQGLHETVTELIETEYNKNGILMSVEEAAKQVENYLVEEAAKMMQFEKVKSRLAPKVENAQASAAHQSKQQSTQTLTNAVNQQSSPKRLSEKERIQRAILAAQGKLNQ